jgi:galactonate dehydratase
MRVTGVKTFLVHPGGGKHWLFVKVETDAGIYGWGECYTQADRDRTIALQAEQLGRYLVGRDPFAIKHFTTTMYLDWAGKRGSMEFYCALSGIEQALWDIVGKATGQPVYNLLGGPCRERIRVYANGWGGGAKTPEAIGAAAAEVVARGFTALKFDPFPGPWREIIGRDEEREAVARVRAVREAVGPDVDILVEVHRRLGPEPAARVATALAPYDPFWYEEPTSSRQLSALVEARRRIDLPLVAGEELYTKLDFRPLFESGAVDIINPDVCNCGGILELKEIAAMAEPYAVAVAPHNYNSTTMGLAATVHVSACLPNFLITEYFVNWEEAGAAIARPPLVAKDGYIELPRTPGLGLDLDEDALLARGYREFPLRTIRRPGDEGP